MHGMFGSRPSFAAFSVSALAFVPRPLASASASTHSDAQGCCAPRGSRLAPCAKPAVEVIAGTESATFSLERCDGEAIPASIDKLSILARPADTPKPKEPSAGKRPRRRGRPGHPPHRRAPRRAARARRRPLPQGRRAAAHRARRAEVAQRRQLPRVGPRDRLPHRGRRQRRGRGLLQDAARTPAAASTRTAASSTSTCATPARVTSRGSTSASPGEAPKYVSAWPLPTTPPKQAAEEREAGRSSQGRDRAGRGQAAKPHGQARRRRRERAPKPARRRPPSSAARRPATADGRADERRVAPAARGRAKARAARPRPRRRRSAPRHGTASTHPITRSERSRGARKTPRLSRVAGVSLLSAGPQPTAQKPS